MLWSSSVFLAHTFDMSRSLRLHSLHSTTPKARNHSELKLRLGQRLQPPCASSKPSLYGGPPAKRPGGAAVPPLPALPQGCVRAWTAARGGCSERWSASWRSQEEADAALVSGSGRKPPSIAF